MNKGLVMGLVILVVIVLGFGLYFVTSGKSADCERATPTTKSIGGYEITKDLAVLMCYTKLAEEKNDPYVCENAKNETIRQSCYLITALKSKDINACQKISDSKSVESCYMNVAANNKDSSICDRYFANEQQKLDACKGLVKAYGGQ